MQFTNSRTGEVINTNLDRAGILAAFGEVAQADSWLWYWLVKTINDAASAAGNKDMIAFLADSFVFAVGMGLKAPMIRLGFQERRYKIYLSRRGTLCFKSGAVRPGTSDPIGDEEYVGCLYQGRFLPNKERRPLAVENEFFARLSADPVGFMAACSKDMNRCCYCNLPLEDERSKEVGYGKICAERWGLPWGKGSGSHVVSFAQLWERAGTTEARNIRGLCQAIRQQPRQEELWLILGDALEEAGWTGKKPQAPQGSVVVPAL
jgi:hypothetical protein